MPMRASGRRITLFVVGLLAMVPLAATPAAAATSAQVEQAIRNAKAFLYATQNNNNWEIVGAPEPGDDSVRGVAFGGLTAFDTFALLATGESPRNPKLAGAIEFLKKLEPHGVYAVAARAMVWPYLPQTADVRQLAQHDAKTLLRATKSLGPARGMYHYVLSNEGQDYDLSVAQFAVLGMWSADQMGVEVPSAYWSLADSAWRAQQQPDGGWMYRRNGSGDELRVTPSMTAAGVATLFITQEYLNAASCRGSVRNESIDRGIAWLAAHYPDLYTQKVFDTETANYGLFGISRIGVASGLRYIGNVDWFAQGADFLLKGQQPDGSWAPSGFRSPPTANTAFALLFLYRGRAPVMMNKLQYGTAAATGTAATGLTTGGKWNERPRDVANLARWYAHESEQDLNWQIVDPDAQPEEWHDAPILYIAGNDPVDLPPEQAKKVKRFIDEGGLVVANADCESKPFADSIQKLAHGLYPDYEFRELPDAHPIYTGQNYQRAKWKNKPSVLGLSNGARELFLLLPNADAGKAWQLRSTVTRSDLFELGADVFSYAIDRSFLRYKGDSYLVARDPAVPAAGKTVKLARLRYAGNWDPEPGGWDRIAALVHNVDQLDLTVSPVKLGDGTLAASGCRLAHLTGTGTFRLTAKQRDELKAFVSVGGGTLLVDAAGGNREFATAAEAELTRIFGADAATMLAHPLPGDDPLYRRGDARVARFGYRAFAKKVLGSSIDAPRVHGLKVNDRLAVIYSAEDLSVGLVGMPIDGINGYDPATATAIVRAVVLAAAGN